MSTHVTWQPKKSGKSIYASSLKAALEGEYGFPLNTELDFNDLGFLKGLVAGGIKEAQKLIDAIEKYDCIAVETSE